MMMNNKHLQIKELSLRWEASVTQNHKTKILLKKDLRKLVRKNYLMMRIQTIQDIEPQSSVSGSNQESNYDPTSEDNPDMNNDAFDTYDQEAVWQIFIDHMGHNSSCDEGVDHNYCFMVCHDQVTDGSL